MLRQITFEVIAINTPWSTPPLAQVSTFAYLSYFGLEISVFRSSPISDQRPDAFRTGECVYYGVLLIMRNPPWHRDEIILALDLYARLEPGQISHSNPQIIELSRVLNRLPIFNIRPDEVKFRNANGVALKLSNFLAIDPSYAGKGMASFSRLDEEVFTEFQFDEERLHSLARQIRSVAEHKDLPNKLYLIPEEEENERMEVKEGAVIYKLHRFRERDSKIILVKKEIEYNRSGHLLCEACSFDFHVKYGELGFKYIECHHKVPLSQFVVSTKTTLDDLALVCSNCHRMLHRKLDTLTVSGLKQLLTA